MRFTPFVLSLFLASAMLAQQQPETPPQQPPAQPSPVTVKVGGTVFGEYVFSNVDPQPSAFAINRAYINVTGTFTPQLSFRITPDITRDASGSQNYRLKYAYGQYTRGPLWLRFGMQQTPYIDYVESIYRYRFQGSIFVDREGFLSSSDNGISARYAFAKDRGEIHAGYYNGEGFARAESNDTKAFQVRAAYRPIAGKGWRVAAFADFDRADAQPRDRWVVNTTYEHARGNAGLEYLSAQDRIDSHGWSAWATPRLTKNWEVLLRMDSLNTNDKRRDIEGVAYWLDNLPKGASAAVLVDRDHVTQDGRADETRYAVHLLLSF